MLVTSCLGIVGDIFWDNTSLFTKKNQRTASAIRQNNDAVVFSRPSEQQ